jgi:hypothetical protein
MREACFCGRIGEVEDREPAFDGRRALRCPCGHLEYLDWLSEGARDLLFERAALRQEHSVPPSAA